MNGSWVLAPSSAATKGRIDVAWTARLTTNVLARRFRSSGAVPHDANVRSQPRKHHL